VTTSFTDSEAHGFGPAEEKDSHHLPLTEIERLFFQEPMLYFTETTLDWRDNLNYCGINKIIPA
jgi:hypothetical protein